MRKDCLARNSAFEARRTIRSRDIPASNGKDPNIYSVSVGVHKNISFNVKKSKFDAWNSIHAFQTEEDIRQRLFYPYLPCMFIDIGCCLGSWSLPALAKGSVVYGFEPDKRYLEDLMETIRINNFDKMFFGINMAVFGISGAIIKDLDEIEDVETIKIDDFVESNNLKPEYIKIDVEGMEQHVIIGALQTLKRYKPMVLVENHLWFDFQPKMVLWIKTKMEEIGYVYRDAGKIGNDVRYSFFIHPGAD